jgi:hypothetical protein
VGGGRRVPVTRTGYRIAYLLVETFGQFGRRLAPVRGIPPQLLYRAAARGAARTVERAYLLG